MTFEAEVTESRKLTVPFRIKSHYSDHIHRNSSIHCMPKADIVHEIVSEPLVSETHFQTLKQTEIITRICKESINCIINTKEF